MRHPPGAAVILTATTSAAARQPVETPDTFLIPERAVVISGDKSNATDLVAILYNTRGLHFNDPTAPRFLSLNREGKAVFGIGGFVKAEMYYDFNGENMDGPAFYTIIPDLRMGLGYMYGVRNNYNGEHGKANRIEATLQYSF